MFCLNKKSAVGVTFSPSSVRMAFRQAGLFRIQMGIFCCIADCLIYRGRCGEGDVDKLLRYKKALQKSQGEECQVLRNLLLTMVSRLTSSNKQIFLPNKNDKPNYILPQAELPAYTIPLGIFVYTSHFCSAIFALGYRSCRT